MNWFTEEINWFKSENLRKETDHNIWEQKIKWTIWHFTPIKTVTLKKLLNELEKWEGKNNKYISINYNNSNTALRKITEIEGLKEYFNDEISELFSIENNNWEIYYDIKVKPNKVKEAQQKFKKFKLTNPTEPEKWTKQYSITPNNNSQFTIGDVIADIKKISDEKTEIYIESSELEDIRSKNIDEIPEEYFNLIFRGGIAKFKREWSYYHISWYTKDNLTSKE